MECYDHLFKRAMKAADAGKHTLARDLLREYVEFEPNSVHGWMQLGGQLQDLHEFAAARDAWERAATLDSDVAELAYRSTGITFNDENRFEEAIAALRKAIAIEPTVFGWTLLGFAYGGNGDDTAAIKAYQSAIKMDPSYQEAYYNLGCRYRLGNEYKKAIRCFHQAIEFDPKYAIAYAELGFALCHPNTRDALLRAKPFLEKAVELDPHYFWARIYLGYANYELDKYQNAIEQYRAAVRISPADSLAHEFLGEAYACTDDLRRAKQHMRKAVKLEPNRAGASRKLGRWYLYWGNNRDAEKCLLRAQRLGDKSAVQLLRRIRPADRVPNTQRQPICRTCGEPMKTKRNSWWCVGCGTDLRAPKERRKLVLKNPNFSKPRK